MTDSIFHQTPVIATYRATIQFTGAVLGGVPQPPPNSNPMECHFSRLGSHPALQARQIKACLKEAASVLNLGQPQMAHAQRKAAARSTLKEMSNRVFIKPDLFRLEGGQPQQPLVRQQFLNVKDKTAVRTDIYERLLMPAASFEVMVEGDYISPDDWARIWEMAGDLGVSSFHGTYGRFRLVQWERIHGDI